jgi:DNA helicase HerA-like ATPase
VRLVRSKGGGVYFVTQSPADVPEIVLSQLGNRIQHGLRAYSPKDQKMIRAAAQAFRPNPALKVREVITELGIGEALVSVLQADGSPTMVERVRIVPPQGQIGPISDLERSAIVEASDGFRKYRAPAESAKLSLPSPIASARGAGWRQLRRPRRNGRRAIT